MDICDRIRRARRAGKTHCNIVNGRMAVVEAARAFGLADDSAIFRSIGRAEADAIAIRILHTDLAYGSKIMALARATHLWKRFLEAFEGQDVEFSTNAGSDACSWMPATDATFDLGVLVIGTTSTGCLWVEDEDQSTTKGSENSGHTVITPPRRLIRQRREQLGIGMDDLARRIGVSIPEYRDLELYDYELPGILPLENARSLAAILGFELGTLLGAGSLAGRAGTKPRHTILAEARARLGISTNKMAEDIGYDEAVGRRIEHDGRALEAYPYDMLKSVADYLKLDPADLLCAPSEQANVGAGVIARESIGALGGQ